MDVDDELASVVHATITRVEIDWPGVEGAADSLSLSVPSVGLGGVWLDITKRVSKTDTVASDPILEEGTDATRIPLEEEEAGADATKILFKEEAWNC